MGRVPAVLPDQVPARPTSPSALTPVCARDAGARDRRGDCGRCRPACNRRLAGMDQPIDAAARDTARDPRRRRTVRVEHPLSGPGCGVWPYQRCAHQRRQPGGIDRTDPKARDDIGILNVLTLPVGRPVVVQLTSRDVVHSFTLNEMRVKQDATPGLTVRTWFTPTLTGRWEIGCSQLCGLGHYRMRGEYSVLTEDGWARWLQAELALLSQP